MCLIQCCSFPWGAIQEPRMDEVNERMMVLIHVDWAGTMDELKELDKDYKESAEKTEGVEFKGRLIPMNKKYHFTYFAKAKGLASVQKWMENWPGDRDYSKMTHGEWEFYADPA